MATDVAREQWLRAACVELDQRLRAGEPARAEEYLSDQDGKPIDAEFALELIYAEYLARERRGELLQPDQWCRRFDRWKGPLARLLEVHRLAQAEGASRGLDSDTRPGATQPDLGGAFHGERVGQYELIEEIGRGGMGVVYKARQLGLDRAVAVKMILAHQATRQMRARFRKEAETIARLRHPNIVQIHEVGEQDGCPFLSMELVEGRALDQELAQAPLTARRAAELVETLARAMHYAHSLGVVHRDLKPANVLVDRDGAPKITDFGLVKLLTPSSCDLDAGRGSAAEPSVSEVTATGQILGTPSYMAPEQTGGRGGEVGPAADVYSLGAILYEALCGRAPFRGETVLDTLDQVRSHDPAPPSRLRPKLARDLETICLKCLAKEPHRRYASAEHLADDLRRFLSGEPIHARPTPWWERLGKWARRRPALATLFLAIVLGSVGVLWQWLRAEASRAVAVEQADLARKSRTRAVEATQAAEKARQRESAGRERAERLLYAHEISLAYHEQLSHNPKRARHLLLGTRSDLRGWEWGFLDRFCRDELLTLGGFSLHAWCVTFSPDRTLVAASSGEWNSRRVGEVKIWDTMTGQERLTLRGHPGSVLGAAFSPDGKRLATAGVQWSAGGDGVRVWDTSDGRPLLELRSGVDAYSVAYSPDGRLIATGSADGKVRLHDSESGELLRSMEGHSSFVSSLVFDPSGRRLVSGGRDGTVRVWDTLNGRELEVLPGHGDVRAVAYSPDGRQLALGTYGGFVKWFDMTGDAARELAMQPRGAPIGHVVFSPDGRLLAISTRSGVDLVDSRTHQNHRSLRGAGLSAAFTSDGRRVAVAGLDRDVRIWDLTLEPEPRKFEVLKGVNVNVVDMAFQPDGARLAIAPGETEARARNDQGSLRLLQISTQRETRFGIAHRDWLTGVAYSPDGRRIATSGQDGAIHLTDAAGQEVNTIETSVPVTAGVAFTSDGRHLVSGDAEGTVRVFDAETGEETRCLRGHGNRIGCVAARDGQHVATGDLTGVVFVWDVASGRELGHFQAHQGAVKDVEFQPKSGLLATAGEDAVIHAWDLAGLPGADIRPVATLRGHTQAIAHVCFNPDGTRLASKAHDSTTKIWDVSLAQELLSLGASFPGHDGPLRFSPDGQRLVVAEGRWLTILDAGTPEPSVPASTDDSETRKRWAAWHMRQAGESAKAGRWFAAAFHRDRELELVRTMSSVPLTSSSLVGRASAAAELESWDQAAADIDEALALGSADTRLWPWRAMLRLREDDLAGYRADCQRWVQEFIGAQRAGAANSLAWACVLAPGSVDDVKTIVSLAERAVAEKKSWATLNTLGAALVRADRPAEAIPILKESIRAQGKGGGPQDWVFLAIAYRALGHHDDARRWVDKSSQWLEQARDAHAKGEIAQASTWQGRLEVEILLREAHEIPSDVTIHDLVSRVRRAGKMIERALKKELGAAGEAPTAPADVNSSNGS